MWELPSHGERSLLSLILGDMILYIVHQRSQAPYCLPVACLLEGLLPVSPCEHK